MTEPKESRSFFLRLFRGLTTRRNLKRMLLLFLWLVTGVFLVYAVENWRGRRAWDAARQKLEKSGQPLDWRVMIPKPVPDAQNFAAQPIVQKWFEKVENQKVGDPDSFAKLEGIVPRQRDTGARHFRDLVAWAKALETVKLPAPADIEPTPVSELTPQARSAAAPKVLEGLAPYLQSTDELLNALDRPYSCYPIQYTNENPWQIVLPHLAKVKGVCIRVQLRATAKLAAGDTAGALEDVRAILRLAETLNVEPFLISALVRIACVQYSSQPVWEGIADGRWTDPQLEELSRLYLERDFFPALVRAAQLERGVALETVDYTQKRGSLSMLDRSFESPSGPDRAVVSVVTWIAPSGWYAFEKANYCRIMDNLLWDHVDIANRRFDATGMDKASDAFQARVGNGLQSVWRHELAVKTLLPALNRMSEKFSKAHTLVHLTALACALERNRLATGVYPDSLSALVPRYLPRIPRDLISGEPYVYKTQPPRYLLYSVGWNEKDDGGTPPTKDAPGDWVWGYYF